MAQDQTVVDHLLLGRQALHDDVDQATTEIERLRAEIERLTGAIEQLDSVIAMIGSGTAPALPARSASPARAESAAPRTRPSRTGAPAKRAVTQTRKPSGPAPKSIRVHVLEMLAAENRDWTLAEIIDRIHGAGIQAHDDAVRSITIKLMKDGRVERVGRGQYRLASNGSPRSTSESLPESTPESFESVTEAEAADAPDPVTLDSVDTTTDDSADSEPVNSDSAEAEPSESSADDADNDQPGNVSYAPPLNLGQPWS